jgi:Ca2+-binding RTX toxin-like protein
MAQTGTNGVDIFLCSIFADEIFGLGGTDIISGSPGADRLDGGAGEEDVVDYGDFFFGFEFLGGAVDVDLERAVQFGGLAEGDVLINIEDIDGSAENDTIRGNGVGNDLFGNGGDDVIEGRGGDDFLHGDRPALQGEAGDDFLDGGAGRDALRGDVGNDTLIGGRDADDLDGGTGIDTASYAESIGGVSINLATGNGSGGDAAGDVLANIENVIGSAFTDTLSGSSAANVLDGGANSDVLAGRGGADTLNGGSGSDTATYAASAAGVFVDLATGIGTSGDAEGDTLISIERLIGSAFTDVLIGSDGANTLDGGAGSDFLLGGLGNDIYVVDNAADSVGELGGSGLDEVRASVSYTVTAGADIETLRTTNDNAFTAINLTGNAAGNNIVGNNGANTLNGGGGNDQLAGRGGNDVYIVDSASDTVVENGGQGFDTVFTSASYTLTAGADVELLTTIDDDSTAALDVTGNASSNIVRGNDGNNVVNGGAGNDTLAGLDGQDAFLFDTALDAAANVDEILDFIVADDTIRLDDAVFAGLTAGGLDATQFALGTAAQDATDRIVYDDTTGALFFDQDGVGGAAAVQFATIGPGLALTNQDFLVV